MPIPVISSFSLKGKFPIDERMIFETIEDMKNYSKNFLPDMYFCFVKEDQKLYTYSVENSDDPNTGCWRIFEGGSSEGAKRYKHTQTLPSSTWNVQHSLGEQYLSSILCIDENGDEIIGDIEYKTKNLVIISFIEPVQGVCIVTC